MRVLKVNELPDAPAARLKTLKQWAREWKADKVIGLFGVLSWVIAEHPEDGPSCLEALELLAEHMRFVGSDRKLIKLKGFARRAELPTARRAVPAIARLVWLADREGAGALEVLAKRGALTSEGAEELVIATAESLQSWTAKPERTAHTGRVVALLRDHGFGEAAERLARLVGGAPPPRESLEAIVAEVIHKKPRALALPSKKLVFYEQLSTGGGVLARFSTPTVAAAFGGPQTFLALWGEPVRWKERNRLDFTGLLAGDPSFFEGVSEEALTEEFFDDGTVLKPRAVGGDASLPAVIGITSRQSDARFAIATDGRGKISGCLVKTDVFVASAGGQYTHSKVKVAKRYAAALNLLDEVEPVTPGLLKRFAPPKVEKTIDAQVALEPRGWAQLMLDAKRLKRDEGALLVALLRKQKATEGG